MTIRDLRADEVSFKLDVGPEQFSRIEDHFDESLWESIKKDFESNVWAFADVSVTARWNGIENTTWLGCVSCSGEKEFRESAEYADLCQSALDTLNLSVKEFRAKLAALEVSHPSVCTGESVKGDSKDNWYPANGGTETPITYRSGAVLLYVYQPSTGRHAYLDTQTDLILEDEHALALIAKN